MIENIVKGVVCPIVHLNGTSKQELLDLRFNTIDAVHSLGDVLAKMTPNGRDYYPKGPHAIGEASDQHTRRIEMLKGLIEELMIEIETITN